MKVDNLKYEECCGCTACVQICPKEAIRFERDEKKFGYPIIDRNKCIECGLCDRVCKFYKTEILQEFPQEYYAAKSKNIQERMRSRSGGAFFLVAKEIINNGGIVYGVIQDDNLQVKFLRGVTIEDCIKMQGSKYVESNIEGVYQEVKKDIQNGKSVLFSGTACQVAGLKGYLGQINLDNLWTIDIVCHGVTSVRVYEDYIQFIQKKYRGKIEKFNFRDKLLGWEPCVESYVIKGKKHYSDNYSRLFFSRATMRPSCSNCAYANYNRPADMTLADCWGINKVDSHFNDDKGVSAIIINSRKGQELFRKIKVEMDYVPLTKEQCDQPNLRRATPKSDEIEEFWNLYERRGIRGVLKKYGGYDILRRIKWKIKDLPKMLKCEELKQ